MVFEEFAGRKSGQNLAPNQRVALARTGSAKLDGMRGSILGVASIHQNCVFYIVGLDEALDNGFKALSMIDTCIDPIETDVDQSIGPESLIEHAVRFKFSINLPTRDRFVRDFGSIPECVYIEVREQRGAGIKWVIKEFGSVLNHEYEWEYEPLPSSRTDDFISRTRHTTFEDALSFLRGWERLIQRKIASETR